MRVVCPHCHSTLELPDGRVAEPACPACGSGFRLEGGATTAWSPADGQRRVGKFELIDTVGVGGFGTVFKARDAELDRIVAIKVPRAGNLTSQADLDRFLREARSVAQLRHPSIVSVYEAGQSDGVPYLVSEFVQGLTLADLLSSRRPSPQASARLLATVAEALHYAHEQGVVHRDVKPANILLSGAPEAPVEQYTPHLMDFGLAKRDAGEITITIDGQVLGTPAYMSPEQARGEGHAVDGRSDVYSVGVILYEMLTGELPFRGTTRMLLHQVLHEEPRTPRTLNERIPRDLQTICLKAMAKEPGRRYQTARELADDLHAFLEGEPIKARPIRRAEQMWRWCRRNPTVAGLTATIALLLLVGAAGAGLAVYRIGTLARRELDLAAQMVEDAARLNSANQLIDSARVSTDRGDWATALAELTPAVKLRPDNPVPWADRGNLYSRLGLWDEAAADVAEQFRLLPPAEPAQWFQHACLRLHVNDAAGYRKVCADMVERFGRSDDPVALNWTASACTMAPEALPDPAVAVRVAEQCVRRVPQAPLYLATLGTALFRAGQLDEAAARFREAQEANEGAFRGFLPTRVWAAAALAHERLGQAAEAQRCFTQAEQRLDEMVRSRSAGGVLPFLPHLAGMPGARSYLSAYVGPIGSWAAELLDGEIVYNEAATALRKPAGLDEVRFRLLRSGAYAALGQFDKAEAQLVEAIARRSHQPDLRLERARLAARQQRWETAEAEYAQAVAILPAAPAPRLERARFRAARGQVGPAAEDYSTALDLLPEAGGRVEVCGELVNQDAVLARVAALRPSDLVLRTECARAYQRLQKFERAIDCFSQALALRADDRQLWLERGLAHGELAHWEQAGADFERTFALKPPEDLMMWQVHACLRLETGDADGYRKVCAQMLQERGTSDEQDALRFLPSTFVLAPRALDDPQRVVALAERRLDRLTPSFWALHIVGLAYCRAGRFREALEPLQRSTELQPTNQQNCLSWLALAMTYAALGQPDEARRWLDKAEAAIAAIDRARPADWKGYKPPGWVWWDWWKVERLRAEARRVVSSK